MRFLQTLFVIVVLSWSCHAKSANRIVINIPSAELESDQIWRTIQDIRFFEKNNYQVSLPQSPLIERLKTTSREEALTSADYASLKAFVREEVYDKADYLKGYEKIKENVFLINKMVNSLSQTHYPWNFKEFEIYQVNLTMYGPGGSFNPDEGSILILTTPEGKFKQYDNPANTIIHEITHIGIQQSIIDKHIVKHALKERIVDTIVLLNFGSELPDYKIQEMGYEELDDHLKIKPDLMNLEDIVVRFTRKK